MKLLIIDDDASWAMTLEMMVNQLGYQVAGIADSLDFARKFLQTYPVDLILCDVMVNRENAIEFFLNLISSGTPVVFITNYADESYYEQTGELKKSRFLVRPFHSLTLKSIIESEKSRIDDAEVSEGVIVRGVHNQRITVPFGMIYWISVEKNYCSLIVQYKKYALKVSLAKLSQQLDGRFVQVHKGFCVNGDFITRTDMKGNQVFVNGDAIPIGYIYRKRLLAFLAKKSH